MKISPVRGQGVSVCPNANVEDSSNFDVGLLVLPRVAVLIESLCLNGVAVNDRF